MRTYDLNLFSIDSINRLLEVIKKYEDKLPLVGVDGKPVKLLDSNVFQLVVTLQDTLASTLQVMSNDLKTKYGVSPNNKIKIKLELEGSRRLQDIEKYLQEVFSLFTNMRDKAIAKYPEAKDLFEKAMADSSMLKVMLTVLDHEDLAELDRNQLIQGGDVLDALSKL